MKKKIFAIISLFMIMSFSTVVSAAEMNNDTGGTLTVTSSGGTTCPGPDLTFNPSPSSLMSIFPSATNFTAIAASSKTTGGTGGNGIEYAIDSGTSVIYQKVQAADSEVTATTGADNLPTGFTDKAGVAAPTTVSP